MNLLHLSDEHLHIAFDATTGDLVELIHKLSGWRCQRRAALGLSTPPDLTAPRPIIFFSIVFGLAFCLLAPLAALGTTMELFLDRKPLAAERLFASLPGEKEWSYKVYLAHAEISNLWTLTVPNAAGATIHPSQTYKTRDGTLYISGQGPTRFGIELPDRRILVFLDPPEAPPPASAKILPSEAATTPDATTILQSLIDSASPGDTVFVPPGRFTIGTIFLRPGVRLHLARRATLVASVDPARYPQLPNYGGMEYALIVARNAHSASLTGYGEIDAQGHRFRRAQTNTRHLNMRLLAAIDTRDLTIENVTLRDAFAWTGHFQNCQNLRVSRVATIAEINFPGWNKQGDHVTWNNADGLNPDGCRDVLFEDLFLHTGDDAVAVKNMNASNRVEHVTVRRATIWTPAAGLKIGTESRGDTMRDIRFEDIHIARAGRAMVLDVYDTALVYNVASQNISITRCEQGLVCRAGKRTDEQAGTGRLADVVLENICFVSDTFPPSYLETPKSSVPIGRIAVHGWSAAGRPASNPAEANFRRAELSVC